MYILAVQLWRSPSSLRTQDNLCPVCVWPHSAQRAVPGQLRSIERRRQTASASRVLSNRLEDSARVGREKMRAIPKADNLRENINFCRLSPTTSVRRMANRTPSTYAISSGRGASTPSSKSSTSCSRLPGAPRRVDRTDSLPRSAQGARHRRRLRLRGRGAAPSYNAYSADAM
jgi:hypothetical protein